MRLTGYYRTETVKLILGRKTEYGLKLIGV